MPRRNQRPKVVAVCITLCALGGLLSLSAAAEEVSPVQRSRYEAAQKLIRGQQYVAARPLARLIVAQQPTWSSAWILLGVSYGNDDAHFDLAEAAFEQAAELDKEGPDPLRNLAAMAARRGDADKAATLLEKAADLAHDDHDVQIAAAHALRTVRRSEEAKERFQTVLDNDPKEIRALTGLGALHVELGEYSQAVAIYRKALDAGADSPILFNNLADALVRAARYDEAIAVVDQGTANREDPALQLIKGRALMHKGEYGQAEATLSLVANFDKKGDQAGYALYLLGQDLALQGCNVATAKQCGDGQAAACCGKDRKALEAFLAAEKATKILDDIAIRIGLAQFAVGQLEDAEATLREHVDARGDKVEAEAFGALAVTLYGFGEPRDIDEAVRLYREASELATDFDDIDRLEKFRMWPPQAIEIVRELRTRANLARPVGAPPSARGCACSVVDDGGSHVGLVTCLGVLLAAVGRRRGRHG